MTRRAVLASVFALAAATALVLGACGGGDATPAVIPSPAPTTRPVPTPTAAPAPTATAAPAATSTVAPTVVPTPAGGAVATPTVLQGKRGGTLQLSVLSAYLAFYDTYESRGGVPTRNPHLSNLIWPDPYNPQALVGDAAEGWEFSRDGTVLTFKLRPGIKFHDGMPLTSKDVVYNVSRAWKPLTPKMVAFKGRINVLQSVEAVDDLTVRLTLSAPSATLLTALSISFFLLYPAHIPFPEKDAEYRQSLVGSGPFKLKAQDPNVKTEYVRNDAYFKPGLPYLDGVVLNAITDDAAVFAAFRTARLDAVSLDYASIENQTDTLVREQGFIRYPITPGLYGIHLSQKPPFNDARVREAISLALDREAVLATSFQGKGSAYASPLLPPERGGQFGFSEEQMKQRPGFRPEKRAEDIARAKQLLAEAGVDPSKYSPVFLGLTALATLSESLEASVRTLGFRTKLDMANSAAYGDRQVAGDFDMTLAIMSILADDPLDHLGTWVLTGAGSNFGKWSDPALDKLFLDQDKDLDASKRKQTLAQLQDLVLKDNHTVLGVWRGSYSGHMPWVKNYPSKLPFGFSPRFKWEQVYLER